MWLVNWYPRLTPTSSTMLTMLRVWEPMFEDSASKPPGRVTGTMPGPCELVEPEMFTFCCVPPRAMLVRRSTLQRPKRTSPTAPTWPPLNRLLVAKRSETTKVEPVGRLGLVELKMPRFSRIDSDSFKPSRRQPAKPSINQLQPQNRLRRRLASAP